MEVENWELNEKDKEFGKWAFGSLACYFPYLFIHYFCADREIVYDWGVKKA